MAVNRIVVALGGNALQQKGEAHAEAQERVAAKTASQLIPLVRAGHQLVIVHGNGPQVGNIVLHEEAINTPDVPTLPLDSSGAMSQGLIGYWLQQAFLNELKKEGIDRSVSTVVTQVLVDKNDPAFQDPTKPIGPFYDTEESAHTAARERNFIVKEDSGRGWRRTVPSPRPRAILEIDTINILIQAGVLVIAAGGGGIPVVQSGYGYEGIEAVIDKDFSGAVLADMIDADILLILTSVDGAMINFGTPKQEMIRDITVDTIKRHIAAGSFAPGSMLPKILASLQFVEGRRGRTAIITSLANVTDAINGKAGTIIRS